jgi:hypothetical protein
MDAATGDFEKSAAELPCSGAPQNLKFERADWTSFRTVEGLQQKAGVPAYKLPALVLKELTDNALDAGGQARVGKLPDGGYFIENGGGGIEGTPAEIGRLFSISRPLISTKLLRLPTRGALGNGLRVVAGAVLASAGTLTVTTRNHRIELRPDYDGTTKVLRTTEVDFPTGTRVEISFGPALPSGDGVLAWAQLACRLAQGKVYAGRASPWWYDGPQFQELLFAYGARPVRELIAELDGCTGATAGVVVATAKLNRALCNSISREQATALLEAARLHARPVNAERLGAVGPDAFPGCAYVQEADFVKFGSIEPWATIPFVIECWAQKTQRSETHLTACVNRTPVTGVVDVDHNKRNINAFGCGLSHTVARAPIAAQFALVINVTTPYMPITSDGKAPDLKPFLNAITTATEKTVRKAHRPNAAAHISIKSIVYDNLADVIADVGSNGKYEFNPRHLLYPLRPIVWNEIGKELLTKTFEGILTDYENEFGEIEGMFRKARGSLRHPHTGETIMLSTRTVANYKRPLWLYSKLVYIEKEGFNSALAEDRWQERHDCTVMSSEGFSTRAARDFVDKLAEHDELVTVFLVHDGDAHGPMIYQTFQEATKARGARKIRIINLGLEPWEAITMGLPVEEVEEKDRRKPVADYVRERTDCAPDGTEWEEWLQTHRIELNAMKPERFIAWLDAKMAAYEKLIPPEDILEEDVNARIAQKVRDAVTERILRENDAEGQIAKAIAAITTPDGTALATGIKKLFKTKPAAQWRDHIESVATELTGAADDPGRSKR